VGNRACGSAAEQDNRAKTLAQPKIFTQDNVAASVNSGQTRWTLTTVVSGAAVYYTSRPVTALLSLNVTPRVSNDGFVTMTVAVTNDAFSIGSSADNLVTDNQAVNSQITVKDGETAVIGGVFQTSEVKNFTAVPFLHKIPILGWLFKSNLPNAESQKELLVFLTPHILDRGILKPEDSTNASLSY
jgi:type IV pilus assembly protein PilQ